jgi:hypothetical protein
LRRGVLKRLREDTSLLFCAPVHQGERIILPRALDVAQNVLDLLKPYTLGRRFGLVGTYVSDAFHQIPLRQDEGRFTVAEFSGQYYVLPYHYSGPPAHQQFGVQLPRGWDVPQP